MSDEGGRTEPAARAHAPAHAAHDSERGLDRVRGRTEPTARGFAFVEMADANTASNAIRGLDGSDLRGRNVNEAQGRRSGGGDDRDGKEVWINTMSTNSAIRSS